MSESSNGVELKCWMLREKVKPGEIKEALDLNDTSAISHFVNGNMTSRPIAAYLLGRGCPKNLVDVKAGRVAA